MTLTTWFRDYVYQSLGGTRRQRRLRTIGAIFLTMGLMGLWHGAEWHFVSFGLISAAVLVGYLALRVWNGGRRLLGGGIWPTILSVAIGNLVIFTIMIFFRADDLPTAWQVLSGSFVNGAGWDRRFDIPLAVLLIAWGLHIVRGTGLHDRFGLKARRWPAPLRGAFWTGIIVVIAFGAVERVDRFIYFQF